MNTDITFIIADNQDITRMGMHGYISAIFSGCRMIDVTDKKELMPCGQRYREFSCLQILLNSYPNTLLNIIYNILPFQSARRVKYT